MDFTKLSKWSSRARNFHDSLQGFLGDVLEGERELLTIEESEHVPYQEPFVIRDDIENALLAPSRGRAKVTFETRFAALAPFFEAGFVFEVEHRRPRLRSMFLLGRVFVPQGKEELVGFQLPTEHFEGVRRGRVKPLLRAYRLENLGPLADADVFAVSVVRNEEHFLVLLICNRPQPWQVGVMEKAYEILTRNPTK